MLSSHSFGDIGGDWRSNSSWESLSSNGEEWTLRKEIPCKHENGIGENNTCRRSFRQKVEGFLHEVLASAENGSVLSQERDEDNCTNSTTTASSLGKRSSGNFSRDLLSLSTARPTAASDPASEEGNLHTLRLADTPILPAKRSPQLPLKPSCRVMPPTTTPLPSSPSTYRLSRVRPLRY